MEKYKTIPMRVSSGIRWLNKVKPGWRKKVDLNVLSMASAYTCVCGQAFKKYFARMIEGNRGVIKGKTTMTTRQASERGFFEEHKSYDGLQREWVKRLRKMRI